MSVNVCTQLFDYPNGREQILDYQARTTKNHARVAFHFFLDTLAVAIALSVTTRDDNNTDV